MTSRSDRDETATPATPGLDAAPPQWDPQADPALLPRLSQWIDAGRTRELLAYVKALHPADGARLLEHLSEARARAVVDWLPAEQAGPVLVEVADDFRARLLDGVSKTRLQALVDGLDTDDAADVLDDLPPETVQEVLSGLEDAEAVQELLGYDASSAGGIMAAQFVSVPVEASIAEAIDALRQHAAPIRDLYAVYVVDAQAKLLGELSLRDLLLFSRQIPVSKVMDREVRSVPTDLDQEQVASIMERYDLASLPVVDATHRLVGCITIDDVIDVIREETEEDIQRMSGVSGGEEPTDTVWRIIAGRLPWLVLGLMGTGLSGLVIGGFEDALQRAVILAGFIPVIMGTAGNVGIQSSSIAVQGLAAGDVWQGDLLRRLGKESLVAVVNGFAIAALMGLFIWILAAFVAIHEPLRLALTAGIALVAVVLLATIIGATVPLLLHRLNIDPALATGPFITTSNDILGVIVFFVTANRVYLA